MFKTILFPVDQSREAREAADIVADLIKIHSSDLIILSVVEKKEGSAMNSESEVAKILEGAKALFSQQGIEAQIIEKEGIASFAICDVADEVNADLIVMGCRGLGLIEDGTSESVTNRVINLSPCPVLVVP
ncbi:MAG: universal stress protein [Xenococcaceae cyanobacterium MO_188.B29]|nr:universal stress protein [Xenococcaceae cyanobacterium MO_188.B29]